MIAAVVASCGGTVSAGGASGEVTRIDASVAESEIMPWKAPESAEATNAVNDANVAHSEAADATLDHYGHPDDASASSCPAAAGPTMVRVPAPDGSSYCIDTTEVTSGQYGAFVAAGVPPQSTTGEPSYCAWNSTYAPIYEGPSSNYPAAFLDWCDAYAYCLWAGKRLCGKIGGGANDYEEDANATLSQWFNACSAGGVNAFPYGDSYNGTACNNVDYGGWSGGQNSSNPQEVGQATACVGGYPGLYDMSGNVLEWEDSCERNIGADDYCHNRGGAAALDEGRCDLNLHSLRSAAMGIIGFRCCSE